MSLSVFSLSRRSSVSSKPALTRGSTETDSTVITPLDHPTAYSSRTSKDFVAEALHLQDHDTQGYYSQAGSNVVIHRESARENLINNSYFPGVQSTPRSPATPERHRSAKELINRFESMTPTLGPGHSPIASTQRKESPLPDPPTNRPLASLKDKGRTPLRNSFINLMSVFKGKGKDTDADFRACPYDTLESASPSFTNIVPQSPVPWIQPSGVSSQPLRSGPVLHLSPPPASGGASLPVWTNCKASLFQDRITLDSLSAYGNPVSSSMILSKSADVHSISKGQVDQIELSLLPNFGKDLHIFEISFLGGPPEKFAVSSVTERTAWVSSIWDALLPTNPLESRQQLSSTVGSSTIEGIEVVPSSIPALMERQCSQVSYETIASSTLAAGSVAPSAHTAASSTLVGSSATSTRTASSVARLPRADQTNPFVSTPRSITSASEGPAVPPKGPELERMSSLTRRLIGRMDSINLEGPDDYTRVNTPRTSVSASVARRDSVDSYYSIPNQHLPTPQSNRSRRGRTCGKAMLPTIPSSTFEDNQSIYDSYATDSPAVDPGSLGPRMASPSPKDQDTNSSSSRNLERGDSQRSAATSVSVIQPFSTDESDDNRGHVVTLIQDHAVQQYSQTTDIGHQITALHNDVTSMATDLRKVIFEKEPDDELRKTLEDVCSRLDLLSASKVSETTDSSPVLSELSKKMDLIAAQIAIQDLKDESSSEKCSEINGKALPDLNAMATSIEEMHAEWKKDIPTIREKLENAHLTGDVSEIKELLTKVLESRTQDDIAKSSITMLNVGKEPSGGENKEDSGTDKLSEILALLQTDSEQKELGANQQTENARYLNELNSWLESFVNNGTTQMQAVARGVEMLCNEVAPQIIYSEEAPEHDGQGRAVGGLRAEIAMLAEGLKSSEQRSIQMQGLLAEVVASSNQVGGSQALNTDTITAILSQQKQDQESILRNIAAELSNDIRGERLRFVEAMKEATAINVQVHVEQFKQELGKEVMTMTCEVGRLQRERQALEQQIADLFTFFAKQRAEMEQNQLEQARQQAGRPLPLPNRLR